MSDQAIAAGRNLYYAGQHGAEDAEDTAQRLALVDERDRLRAALLDLLAAHAMRASCQAGLVDRCKCVPCATARADEVLGPNVEVTG